MRIISALQSSFSMDLKRHLRSPALWFVALAAPIAAHYMVPDKEATYAVLTVNGLIPVLNASVLGLELGVLAATLLTPLAYIFLRAGPTRHRPWQITDITPHSRAAWVLGRWASDTLALWLLLTALTSAGLILGLFRLDGESDIVQTIVALWLPAAPALALVAAIRLFLDARNLTRGWLGDTVFLVVWIALMISGIIGTTDPETQQMTTSPMTDAFGFVSPIIGSVEYPVDAVTIGGASNSGENTLIDAWQGVTNFSYVSARLFWLTIAAGLALVAGLIWAPMKTRSPKTAGSHIAQADILAASIPNVSFSAPRSVASGSTNFGAVVLSEIKLMFRNKFWILVLSVAAVSGLVMPFRTAAGPILFLALIFPLTEASARWQSKTTEQLLNTLGPGRFVRTGILAFASILIALVVALPVTAMVVFQNKAQWLPHIFLITVIVPFAIVGLGAITRSAVAGRLLALIAWYVYLSSAS